MKRQRVDAVAPPSNVATATAAAAADPSTALAHCLWWQSLVEAAAADKDGAEALAAQQRFQPPTASAPPPLPALLRFLHAVAKHAGVPSLPTTVPGDVQLLRRAFFQSGLRLLINVSHHCTAAAALLMEEGGAAALLEISNSLMWPFLHQSKHLKLLGELQHIVRTLLPDASEPLRLVAPPLLEDETLSKVRGLSFGGRLAALPLCCFSWQYDSQVLILTLLGNALEHSDAFRRVCVTAEVSVQQPTSAQQKRRASRALKLGVKAAAAGNDSAFRWLNLLCLLFGHSLQTHSAGEEGAAATGEAIIIAAHAAMVLAEVMKHDAGVRAGILAVLRGILRSLPGIGMEGPEEALEYALKGFVAAQQTAHLLSSESLAVVKTAVEVIRHGKSSGDGAEPQQSSEGRGPMQPAPLPPAASSAALPRQPPHNSSCNSNDNSNSPQGGGAKKTKGLRHLFSKKSRALRALATDAKAEAPAVQSPLSPPTDHVRLSAESLKEASQAKPAV